MDPSWGRVIHQTLPSLAFLAPPIEEGSGNQTIREVLFLDLFYHPICKTGGKNDVNRAFSCDVITFQKIKKTENSRHVGVQRDRSFYANLHEMSDILLMLLLCVESDKIPLLHKLKQLYKRLPVVFLFNRYRMCC